MTSPAIKQSSAASFRLVPETGNAKRSRTLKWIPEIANVFPV
jgi:hypothetical protein